MKVFAPKAFITASLLLAGVMLASCTMATKEPKPSGAVKEATQQLNEIKTTLGTIQNTLDVQKHSIEILEQRVNALDGLGQKGDNRVQDYTEPALLYKAAWELLIEENFNGAGELFNAFVTKHPDSKLADNALYWLGECHYSQKEYLKAIKRFKELVDRYPNGGKVPDALLKTAYAYLSLDDADRAHHYLKLVIIRYPFTKAGGMAEQKLKAFQ